MVTVQDLRKREPELARLKPNDGELEVLIEKAINDFCLQCKLEYGYSIANIETKPKYDILIEFLTLSYVFESLIKTEDIYLVKADRYKNLYNEWFAKLNYNNTNINGLYATCETIPILR